MVYCRSMRHRRSFGTAGGLELMSEMNHAAVAGRTCRRREGVVLGRYDVGKSSTRPHQHSCSVRFGTRESVENAVRVESLRSRKPSVTQQWSE
jgi:hypothetical protein